MKIDINYNVCIPWVWSVAHWLEQQPRKLKMWGSIPHHAHNFLIRFAIGVRTTIELIKIEIILLKNQWGYSAACHSCSALVDIQSAGDAESLVRLHHM